MNINSLVAIASTVLPLSKIADIILVIFFAFLPKSGTITIEAIKIKEITPELKFWMSSFFPFTGSILPSTLILYSCFTSSNIAL